MLTSKDGLTGLLFVVIGASAIFFARSYEFGTARAMGPGYFPIVLGALIAILGAVVAARAIITPSPEPVGAFAPRPILLVLASVLSFAALIRPAGLIVAVSSVVIVGRLAGRQVRLTETLLMAVVIVSICCVLFVYGLSMPLHLLPR